jgi:P-type Cu+ transporter
MVALMLAGPALAAPGVPQGQSAVKDPVCGMSVKPADAKFKSEFQGKTYYFCSERCKQSFDEEPAKYAGK